MMMSDRDEYVLRCMSVENAREETLAERGIIEIHLRLKSSSRDARVFREGLERGVPDPKFCDRIAGEAISRYEDQLVKQSVPGVPSRLTSLERRALQAFLSSVMEMDVTSRLRDREEVFRHVYEAAFESD